MITTAVICPHPPLLFRELAGRQDAAAELRAACLSVLTEVMHSQPERVLVVGGANQSRSWEASLLPRVRRFGCAGVLEHGDLPLSLGVGVRLLETAGWTGPVEMFSVAWDASPGEVLTVADSLASAPGPNVLLVLGDGSARRSEHAPGYVDKRAFEFDAATSVVLAAGDAEGLLAVDSAVARELMAGGRAAFQVMASVVRRQGNVPAPTVTYEGDPFGVMYHVATWRLT